MPLASSASRLQRLNLNAAWGEETEADGSCEGEVHDAIYPTQSRSQGKASAFADRG